MINETVICYNLTISVSNGIWQTESPVLNSLPLFVSQLTIILFVTRLLILVLKPLHQPRLVAEILVSTIRIA